MNFSNVDIFIGGLEENVITKNYFKATRFYYHEKLTWCCEKNKSLPFAENYGTKYGKQLRF
jgi:hypothetical protein